MNAGKNRDITGYRLKLLRVERGLTIREVAEQLEVSSAFISMVENGKSGISLTLLQRLLKIYHVPVADFFKAEPNAGRILHLKDAPSLSQLESGVDSYLLRKEDDPNALEPVLFQLQPGKSVGFVQHEGQEFTLVLDGELSVSVIDPVNHTEEQYTLGKMDSLHFPSAWPHQARNESDKPCTFLAVVAYGKF